MQLLLKLGFKVVRTKGSHCILKGHFREQLRMTVVAQHPVIPPKTINSIISQCGLTREEFLKLYRTKGKRIE